ncbi:MAG TPA: polysaccharide deacetylase family protein [Cyclobacteriaceae bacterium]|nr:polysaccharide deacetylase family protein [Cyclobacteriaceae bacterium]
MKYILVLAALVITSHLSAQQTIQEKLGYPKNTKLLIIHADDIGVSHSENVATIAAMEKGSVNSGSIMVPCPWMPEIATYAKAHPNIDLGLHLTLTAEWKEYKWGTVLPRTEVPSLVDEKGFLPDNSGAVGQNAKPAEVEKELRAQVERAKQFGIDPTHFDTHMGSALVSVDIAKIYVKLGNEYKVPVLMHAGMAKAYLNAELKDIGAENNVVVDNIFMANPPDFKGGMKNFYTKVLKEMPAGLNVILLHAAHDDSEMKAVTVDHPDYGAAWRQADFEFFTSEDCKKALKDNNIKLVTWKEIRDKVVRK